MPALRLVWGLKRSKTHASCGNNGHFACAGTRPQRWPLNSVVRVGPFDDGLDSPSRVSDWLDNDEAT